MNIQERLIKATEEVDKSLVPLLEEAATALQHTYILAMFALQSKRYVVDSEYRNAVDNVLTLYWPHENHPESITS